MPSPPIRDLWPRMFSGSSRWSILANASSSGSMDALFISSLWPNSRSKTRHHVAVDAGLLRRRAPPSRIEQGPGNHNRLLRADRALHD